MMSGSFYSHAHKQAHGVLSAMHMLFQHIKHCVGEAAGVWRVSDRLLPDTGAPQHLNNPQSLHLSDARAAQENLRTSNTRCQVQMPCGICINILRGFLVDCCPKSAPIQIQQMLSLKKHSTFLGK